MARKTDQIQIRVTPEQKDDLKRRAREAGQDLSTYVLSRSLPPAQRRFEEAVAGIVDEAAARFALADLSDFLSGLGPMELSHAVARRPASVDALTPTLRAYVAAMVDVTARSLDTDPPAWTAAIQGPDLPHFATDLRSLRPHLLKASPVPFKRRNLFVDSTVGDRV